MSETTTLSRSELASALAGRTESMQSDPGAHPDSDALIAYHHGDLEPPAASRIEDHLIACADCRESLLDLEEFIQAPTDQPPAVEDLETAAAWRDLRPRIDPAAEAPPAPEVANAAAASTGNSVALRGAPANQAWQALAAMLAVTTLGLAGWTLTQQATIAELRSADSDLLSGQAPDAPEPILLSARGRRSSAGSRYAMLKAEPAKGSRARFECLAPTSSGKAMSGPFDLAIHDPEDQTVWIKKNVYTDPDGYVVLEVPTAFLPRPLFSIELIWTGSDGERLTAFCEA